MQKQQMLKSEIAARESKGDKMPDFKGYLDTYFNTGCCCFDDGDITGIELDGDYIRLIKWAYGPDKKSKREVLEESKMEDLKLFTKRKKRQRINKLYKCCNPVFYPSSKNTNNSFGP